MGTLPRDLDRDTAASVSVTVTMTDLRRVPGCHVYGGTQPLAPGVGKLPKEKNIVFNIDVEESDIKDVSNIKVPLEADRAAPLAAFDEIVKALVPEGEKTQCIFNSKDEQAATTGMVAACTVKAVQSINNMRSLVEEGIAEKDWIEAIVKNTFETEGEAKEGETPFHRGEFDVIKALVTKFPEMVVGKILIDKFIDLAGETGPHLRKCVCDIQAKMDAVSGDEALVLKKKLLNYLERYFYLVCFGGYCRQQGPEKFMKSFVSWLEERKELEDMVEKGIRVWEQITFFSLTMTVPA